MTVPSSRTSRVVKAAATGALFLYVTALFGLTALLQDGLFERDGYYHARLAQLMPERGFSRSFPWTQVSTWKDRYCDKEVLYHAAMMPFAWLAPEAIGGARAFGVLLSLAVVAVLWWMLRAHRTPWPTYFAALPLATGGLFIARLGMVRSHVLSMALLLLGVHLLLRRRWWAVLLLGFVYAWSYTVPFVLVLTALPLAVGQWLGRGGLDWRSVVAAGAGAVLGLALHPYTPLTLETFLTITQIFRMGMEGIGRSGFELGNEIYPYPLPIFFDIYPLLVLLVPALVAVVAARWRFIGAETKGLVLATLFWSAMTTASARFVEYLVLLLVLACAFTARDLISSSGALPPWVPRGSWWRVAGALAALALLFGFHARSMRFYLHYQTVASPPRFFDGAATWMAHNLEPGENVINLYWDDFPDLFYSAPRQHYLWGLDPTFTVRSDYGRAVWLERARRGELPLDGTMAQVFEARYLILRAARATFPTLRQAPFHEVYRDASAVVFRIE